MYKVMTLVEDGRMGGIHYRVARVNALLVQSGIQCVVAFPSQDSDKFQSMLGEAGIEFYPIKMSRNGMSTLLRLKYVLTFAGDVMRITRLLKKTSADIIHCNGVWQIKGVIAARIAGVRSVWHLNDTSAPGIFRKVFRGVLWKWPAALVVASEKTKQYYLSPQMELRAFTKLIPAPVDTHQFRPGGNKDGTSDKAVLHVGTVANINYNKGIHIFLEMARLLNTALGESNVRFSVVGPVLPTQVAYNERLLQDIEDKGLENVEMRGRVDDIPAVLDEFDVYVCSSFNEASPTSVWEAMAMGLPVVSTDVGDVRQVVKKYGCGEVVETGSAIQLANAVEKLARAGQRRKQEGKRARIAACENFELHIVADLHKALYREIVARH